MRFDMLRIALLIATCCTISAHSQQLQPHRAIYNIKLSSKENCSDLVAVKGKMMLEISKKDDGWSVQQYSVTYVAYQDETPELMVSKYEAWESESGDQLTFSSIKTINGKEDTFVSGHAEFSQTGAKVQFNAPFVANHQLQNQTLPPIAHLKGLMKATKTKEKSVLQNHVFDGSFMGTEVAVNTFIPTRQSLNRLPGISKAEQSHYQWPLKSAVFESDDDNSQPSFEMTQNLTNNGIISAYTMKFEDYSIVGELESIEYI